MAKQTWYLVMKDNPDKVYPVQVVEVTPEYLIDTDGCKRSRYTKSQAYFQSERAAVEVQISLINERIQGLVDKELELNQIKTDLYQTRLSYIASHQMDKEEAENLKLHNPFKRG